MILVEADVSDEWDSSTGWSGLADTVIRAAIAGSRHNKLIDSPCSFEVSVKFTDDREVRMLNATYRDQDKPTNVLSFPMADAEHLKSPAEAETGEIMLGDIVLAQGICSSEADEKGVSMRDHAAHLLVHGTLHLLGYDHEMGEQGAVMMEQTERDILASLGIADPYLTEVRS